MSTTIVINESGRVPRFRVRVTVGVGYDSDPEQVEAILLKACEGISEILPSPKARARFREFGDSALVYQLLAWIHDPGDRGRIIHELNTKFSSCSVKRASRYHSHNELSATFPAKAI